MFACGAGATSGPSTELWITRGRTVMVFTGIGWIGSADPDRGAFGAVEAASARVFGAGSPEVIRAAGSAAATRVFARAGSDSIASAIIGTVRWIEASAICCSIKSRMRASRAPLEEPPNTTATT